MPADKRTRLPGALLAGLAWLLCTGVQSIPRLVHDHDYQGAAAVLRAQEQRHPQDVKLKRSLGIVLLESGQAAQAMEKLNEARALRPGDSATLFHLGRAAQRAGDLKLAIEAYSAYLDRPRRDGLAVRARIHELTLRSAHEEALERIRIEKDLPEATENTIAVPDFHVSVRSDTLGPLSRGIAVIMSEDLGRVPGLKVVERARLQALLNELKLAAGPDLMAPRTAPRLGRLLAAQRLAQGALVMPGRERLQLDALVVDTRSGASKPSGKAVGGGLREVIGLEKRLVFQVVDTLGITLTRDLRRAIGVPPTRSFPAFLAFCRGVDFEERGVPDSARAAYETAVRLDRGFRMARERRDELAVTPGEQARLDREETDDALAMESYPGRLMATGSEIGLQSVPEIARFTQTPASKIAANRLTLRVPLPP